MRKEEVGKRNNEDRRLFWRCSCHCMTKPTTIL